MSPGCSLTSYMMNRSGSDTTPVTEFNSYSYNSFITKPNFIKTGSELSELLDFEVKSASLNTHCCLFVVFDIQRWPMRYLRFYTDERERAQHTATSENKYTKGKLRKYQFVKTCTANTHNRNQ